MAQNSNTNQEKFDSITHFLQTGGFNYRVFDLGRKIKRIPDDVFESIEDQKQLYPAPFQKKAWLALLFWEDSKQNEAIIWFLQFPIDELGFLKQEARDAFLIDLLEQTGKNIQAKQQGTQALDELKESPFAFKPSPDRLAMFHALATKELDQKPSQYYQHTRDYLSGDAGYEQWQFLGLQGIADVVARLAEDDNEELLAKSIGLMPEMPLVSFCNALENSSPREVLTQALAKKLKIELEPKAGLNINNQLVAMLLRALSGAEPMSLRQVMLQLVLASPVGKDIEVMVAISGRAWNDLHSQPVLVAFIANLAEQNEMAFNAILSDLMMIPNMREKVLAVMQESNQSMQLKKKLDQFFVRFQENLE
jgi:hypothetical protein